LTSMAIADAVREEWDNRLKGYWTASAAINALGSSRLGPARTGNGNTSLTRNLLTIFFCTMTGRWASRGCKYAQATNPSIRDECLDAAAGCQKVFS